MATEDGEGVRRAEKVGLKRKLTGPPRLLLGKTRTRSTGEDRAETRAKKEKMENSDEISAKCSVAAAESRAELTETVEGEVSSEANCQASGKGDDTRTRKRCRWWSRFSSAVGCIRTRKRNPKESDGSVPPEETLKKTNIAPMNNLEENSERLPKEKKKLNMRTWPLFKRFMTSSVKKQRDGVENNDESSVTFQKKLQKFFHRHGKRRSSGVLQENMEDMMKVQETTCLEDSPTDVQRNGHDRSPEVVMVTAEMSVQLTEDRAATESPDELATESAKDDLPNSADGSKMTQTATEVLDVMADTSEVSVLVEVTCSEKDEVFCDSPEAVLHLTDQRSASTVPSESDPEVAPQEKMDQITYNCLQPSTNGPSIRIELFPPDNDGQEDVEDDVCWGGSSSSENHNHLLLVFGFEHSERQLLQTARSLVRAAMKAAVDQLIREQQSDADYVHREPQDCRDHA
ncbi:uncharacterized protein si:dkey-1h6.8 [Acanthochromis polyacanthus]|uniref:uncharacterized protein si:dkey-1h6.8 n=1 Tax=Acanthochromis polyacanthus TaxID=80966 RepID=UPI002233F1A5|nr:uncharacterized protein si:dkey-1h6.8 [Acanthochromis polyacanthus]